MCSAVYSGSGQSLSLTIEPCEVFPESVLTIRLTSADGEPQYIMRVNRIDSDCGLGEAGAVRFVFRCGNLKGRGTNLFERAAEALRRDYGLVLHSGVIVSPAGRRIWEKLVESGKAHHSVATNNKLSEFHF